MTKIKFKKVAKDAKLPVVGSEHAACFDFFAQRIQRVSEDKYIVYLGLMCEFPHGYVLTFQPRSSITHKDLIMANTPGQIDSDYRGELQVRFQLLPNGVTNFDGKTVLTYPEFPYVAGDRVVQAKLERLVPVEIEETLELSATDREAGGFGSTGK